MSKLRERPKPFTDRTVVITPSRGRPQRLMDMYESVYRYSDLPVPVFVGLDEDDEALEDYHKRIAQTDIQLSVGSRNSLTGWSNILSNKAQKTWYPEFLVSLGDDHEVRTMWWDRDLKNAIRMLDGPGFAYADDGNSGANLCTSWMTHIRVVRALGWFLLPTCGHMYVDNAIMELGRATGRLVYVPEVTIEHMHPHWMKSVLDQTYEDSNNSGTYEKDLKAFRRWRFGPQFEQDVETILNLKW